MPSNNELLRFGKSQSNEEVKKDIPVSTRVPVWRYHTSCPGGIVVKEEKELDRLDKEGWVDHPGKVSILPGHEHLWTDISNVDISVKEVEVELNTEMNDAEVEEVLKKLTNKKKGKEK